MRLTALGVAGTLLLASVSAPATEAASAPEPGITEVDPRGDVSIFRRPEGMTTRDLRSIDLRRLEVTAGDKPGEVRIGFEIRRVARDFEQVLVVSVLPPRDDEGEYWSTDIRLSPQHPRRSVVDTWEQDEARTCDDLRATVRRARGWAELDVPASCLPGGRGRVKVWTLVAGYRRPTLVKANDTLRVPGLHRLIDAAAPPATT